MLKTYVSLSSQAEEIDTWKAYTELIEKMRKMDYAGLYNLMCDTENVLKVLVREESNVKIGGLLSLTGDIVRLGQEFLRQHGHENIKVKLDTHYTYESKDNSKKSREAS